VAGGYSNAVHVIDGPATRASVRWDAAAVRRREWRYQSHLRQQRPRTARFPVIDGRTRAVINLPVGGAGPIAVNERTNRST
jgi:hypothetical protein